MKNIIKNAFLNALATALYVTAIASFLFYASKFFGPAKADTVFIPIIMLSLFVFSAALTGILVFGRPVIWYLDGRKKDAVLLLTYTLGFFLIIIISLFTLYLTL